MRSRIPRPIGRRIDRLARAAHRFHRFAHHPLCAEYAGEVVRLGRRGRVCRGCALSLAGVGTGGLAALACAPSPIVGFAALGVTAALMLPAMLLRARLRGLRGRKLLTRFIPSLAFAYAVAAGALAGTVAGVAASGAGLLLLGVLTRLYRRRGPSRGPCQACPERALATPCRGLAPIVRRERAFQRLAGRWLT